MENKIVDENGEPVGLIEQIRQHEANKPEVSLEEELNKPPRRPNNDTIYGSIEFIEKFQEAIKNIKNK